MNNMNYLELWGYLDKTLLRKPKKKFSKTIDGCYWLF